MSHSPISLGGMVEGGDSSSDSAMNLGFGATGTRTLDLRALLRFL